MGTGRVLRSFGSPTTASRGSLQTTPRTRSLAANPPPLAKIPRVVSAQWWGPRREFGERTSERGEQALRYSYIAHTKRLPILALCLKEHIDRATLSRRGGAHGYLARSLSLVALSRSISLCLFLPISISLALCTSLSFSLSSLR